jgi:hypothetical protein
VVSTAIKDVIDLYGHVVEIADGPEEFVQAIEYLWNEADGLKMARAGHVEQVLQQHDWDLIATQMMSLLEGVVGQRSMPPVAVTGIGGRALRESVPVPASRAGGAE